MYNRRYDRKTVIMKQETDSFSKQPSLTTIAAIEIKNGSGKVNIQGQNADHNHTYLITAKNGENRCADLGQVGSIFNPDDVAGSGLPIEAFDILVFGRKDKNDSFPWWVFVGYLDRKREWRRNIVATTDDKIMKAGDVKKETKAQKIISNTEIKPIYTQDMEVCSNNVPITEPPLEGIEIVACDNSNAVVEAEKPDMVSQRDISPLFPKNMTLSPEKMVLEALESDDIHGAFRKIVENFSEEIKQMESIGAFSIAELIAGVNGFSNEGNESSPKMPMPQPENSKTVSISEATKKPKKDTEDSEESCKAALDKTTLDENVKFIFQHNENLSPFCDEKCMWARICPDEIWTLPIEDFTIAKTCFVICADKKYKHLLLGNCPNGSLMLAVPDRYHSEQRKNAMKLGFIDFWSMNNAKPSDGVYGYWIKNLK